MKTPKYWTISDDGQVTLVSPLCRGFNIEIRAQTKAEATAYFLKKLKGLNKNPFPRLWVKNGAYALAYHNGIEWSVEGGRLDRTDTQGCTTPLIQGGATKLADAPKVASLDYYSTIT